MNRKLLPHGFAYAGLAVFVLAFLTPIVVAIYKQTRWEESFLKRQLAMALMVMGLALIAFSKRKKESEQDMPKRYTAMSISVIATVCILLAIGYRDSHWTNNGYTVMIFQLITYIISFYFQAMKKRL